ncbi:MAG: phosphate permease [Syntrophobacter sp. DG_60]|nr:MAG: phosphate permease [Syntrophobacter sp. DG_60]
MTQPIPIIACGLIALGIGSNDTSNALGICIGCEIIKFKRAVLLFWLFVWIGIILQGGKVMRTVGKELLEINLHILSIALLISAILIIISNWKKLPVSTHQVIIGSLTGSGIASGMDVNYISLLEIILSWVISPLGALFLSLMLYRVMEKTLSKLPLLQIERILRVLLLISGVLIAYNTGANELATVLGPVIHSGLIDQMRASLVGPFFVFLGAVLLSHRVIETIGKGITALDPYSGFAAQFGAGTCVLLFTSLGMPVSTTYCIIGGISGVGLLKGIRTVRFELIKKIAITWVVAPFLAFLICFAVTKVLL